MLTGSTDDRTNNRRATVYLSLEDEVQSVKFHRTVALHLVNNSTLSLCDYVRSVFVSAKSSPKLNFKLVTGTRPYFRNHLKHYSCRPSYYTIDCTVRKLLVYSESVAGFHLEL